MNVFKSETKCVQTNVLCSYNDTCVYLCTGMWQHRPSYPPVMPAAIYYLFILPYVTKVVTNRMICVIINISNNSLLIFVKTESNFVIHWSFQLAYTSTVAGGKDKPTSWCLYCLHSASCRKLQTSEQRLNLSTPLCVSSCRLEAQCLYLVLSTWLCQLFWDAVITQDVQMCHICNQRHSMPRVSNIITSGEFEGLVNAMVALSCSSNHCRMPGLMEHVILLGEGGPNAVCGHDEGVIALQ